MSKAASHFRKTDVKRAVQAVEGAGVKIGRIELDGGKIVIIPGTEPAPPATAPSSTNEWDSVLPNG
jgi:hypothetical protein